VQSKDEIGLYPLHHAASDNRVDNLNLLLDKKADIEAVDKKWKRTALIRAIECGHLDIVRALLKRKASLAAKTTTEFTAMTLAATLVKNAGIVNLLIRHGASVNVQDINLATPIHRAAFGGDVQVLAALLSKADKSIVNMKTDIGLTALHFATQQKHLEAAKLLLK
ncbi:ankyrin, partial [Microthyrium microscopicum]